MRHRDGTDGSLLASLPLTLAALGFSVLPHLPFLPLWITVALLVCAGGRWLIEKRRWRLPPAWQRVALSLACFVGVLASYESVSGVGPGSALLAVMAALKLLETKRRRDQFVLLFISIFLIMASLLREQHIWSLPYLFAGVLLTMTAWLQMSTSRGADMRQSLANSGRLLLYAAPLTVAMWLFFPRIATPFWSVPIDTSSATSGLSDRMSPGDISSLSLSDAVAFRVEFDGDVPASRDRYWRGLVLHRFNGRTWSGWEPGPDRGALSRIETAGAPVTYQVTLEPTNQQWVFALDIPYQWTLEQTFMGPQQQLARAQPIDQRVVYEATSYTSYRADRDLPRVYRSRYDDLPERTNPRTRELAEEMRKAAGSDEAFIDRVLQRFNEEEYYYTLQPPQLGSNSVDEFLFRTQRGFCEHYASAFAVMMRAAGIPARIVLGYQGGELNPMADHVTVRQSDAHAWTEVWLDGRGWARVDPTAAVAPDRIESGMSGARLDGLAESWGLSAPAMWMHRLQLSWDALNARWNEWVLGYGPDNQNRFMQWLGMEQPDWRKMLLTLLALIMLMIAAISVLLFRRYRPPQPDAASALYKRFTNKTGLLPERGETPLAFASRLCGNGGVAATSVDDITNTYLAARYGPSPHDALERLRTLVDAFPRPGSSRQQAGRRS